MANIVMNDIFYSFEFFTDEEIFDAFDELSSDDGKLAAALLLCTCDSNERKAGE